MELEKKEIKRLEKLQRWSKNKSRKKFLYFLITFLCLIFICFIVISFLCWINWKELGWIIFLLMVIIVWCKAVYDLESNIEFLIRIIEMKRKDY